MEELTQQDQYQLMKGWLNERQWRLYVATEAKRIGVGGMSQVAREARVTRKTIRKGLMTGTPLIITRAVFAVSALYVYMGVPRIRAAVAARRATTTRRRPQREVASEKPGQG